MSFDIDLKPSTNFDIDFSTFFGFLLVEGDWKPIKQPYIVVDNSWKFVSEMFVLVDGVWKTGVEIIDE
jgi:hypothetical protein